MGVDTLQRGEAVGEQMRDAGQEMTASHSLMGSLETDQLNKDSSCQEQLSDSGKLSKQVITLMIQMRHEQVIYGCLSGHVSYLGSKCPQNDRNVE